MASDNIILNTGVMDSVLLPMEGAHGFVESENLHLHIYRIVEWWPFQALPIYEGSLLFSDW